MRRRCCCVLMDNFQGTISSGDDESESESDDDEGSDSDSEDGDENKVVDNVRSMVSVTLSLLKL